jgi:maltose alpha-D-glucosyltransferase/alpha-amylase
LKYTKASSELPDALIGMPDDAELLEALRVAAGHISSARWSGCKQAAEVCVHELFPFFEKGSRTCFGAVISFPPSDERYFVPFMLSSSQKTGLRPFEVRPGRFLAEAERSGGYADFALGMMRRRGRSKGKASKIAWSGTVRSGHVRSVHRLGGDTTNVVVGLRAGAGRMVLKSYRTLDPCNPEPEMLGHLSRQKCVVTPRMLGSCSLKPQDRSGEATVLAVLLGHVDGLPAFRSFTGNARRAIVKGLPPHYCLPRRLGEAVAELHSCLFDPKAPASMMPEQISAADIDRWKGLIASRYREALGLLSGAQRARLETAGPTLDALASAMDGWKGGWKIRTHQDLHLGQVLVCRGGFKIIDFEGEPLRKGPQRLEKLPPGRDLGTMLRSFSYAAAAALRQLGMTDEESCARAARWEEVNASSFIKGYEEARPPTLLGAAGLTKRAQVWAAEKALYEMIYEARFRPDWVDIPLEGLMGICTGVKA